jgi:mannan endo-1,4-beta-mannosidase
VVAEVPGLTDCGSHHDVFREKIDELADFFATLADADGDPIPVLFRPFHENNGSWFWWGEGGIDAHRYRVVFRAVWSWMVGYMSEVRDVHQLLWVISPNGGFDMGSEEDYLGHIPGLELVDVLGYDFYAVDFRPGEDPWWGELALGELSVVVRLAEANGKVAAMTEGGTPGGSADGWPADVWSGRLLGPILGDPTARRIAWFQAWANFPPDGPFWGPYLAHPSADDFRSLCDDGRISLEGDLPLY